MSALGAGLGAIGSALDDYLVWNERYMVVRIGRFAEAD